MSMTAQVDPSCVECYNENVVRRFTSGTAIHIKPDPNKEYARHVHDINIAAGAEPIDKREADMMSHNMGADRRNERKRMDAEIDKMVEDSAMEVGRRRGWNLDEGLD